MVLLVVHAQLAVVNDDGHPTRDVRRQANWFSRRAKVESRWHGYPADPPHLQDGRQAQLEDLRLRLEAGLSYTQVARAVGLGKGTVGKVMLFARAAGVNWALALTLSDEELEARLYRPTMTAQRGRILIRTRQIFATQPSPIEGKRGR